MEMNIPNRLTILRFFLALGLFAVLVAIANEALPRSSLWFCLSALLFAFGAATDVLDGYLARKWKLITGFGRIADPFVDKILVMGAFILLIQLSSLIPAWFVVLVVIREFGITALRSQLEGQGRAFGAGSWGKAKMLSQSILIPTVLVYEAFEPDLPDAARYAVAFLVAVTLVLTIASGLIYLKRASPIPT
jgi:CDP-diacylglycerol--glycerol-3-phosphate 3-phosphatidyltransferase